MIVAFISFFKRFLKRSLFSFFFFHISLKKEIVHSHIPSPRFFGRQSAEYLKMCVRDIASLTRRPRAKNLKPEP